MPLVPEPVWVLVPVADCVPIVPIVPVLDWVPFVPVVSLVSMPLELVVLEHEHTKARTNEPRSKWFALTLSNVWIGTSIEPAA